MGSLPQSLARQCIAKRIAIIGAGPCGLAAAKYLEAENFFDIVDIFEQRDQVGGVWKYTPQNHGDGLFQIPQTSPHPALEQPVIGEKSQDKPIFLSPIYETLETNIPNSLMGYSDTPFRSDVQLFPRHQDVQEYLEGYGSSVRSKIQFGKQVLDIRYLGHTSTGQDQWQLEHQDVPTGEKRTEIYNGIVVATGHYSVPYVPDIEGLADWNHRHPRSLSHSKYYRVASDYADQRVIVVGGSASGLDIASQISTTCKSKLLLSQKAVSYLAAGFADNPKIEPVSEISKVDATSRTVYFIDGRTESDVDHILFCTGYLYSLPFLSSLKPALIGDGTRVQNTYHHLFYAPHPSLAFLALPQKVIPFPLSEAQAAVVARVWSGRLTLPELAEMAKWEASVIRERGDGGEFHTLSFPKDAEYINELHDLANSAARRDGLASDGVGKLPRRWGAWEYWARENFPAIRKAFITHGEGRREIRSLSDLHFEFPTSTGDTASNKSEAPSSDIATSKSSL